MQRVLGSRLQLSEPGADPASKFRGVISVIFGSQVSLWCHYCKRDEDTVHNTVVTQKWAAKWPYIANAVFRIAQNHGEKSSFHRF